MPDPYPRPFQKTSDSMHADPRHAFFDGSDARISYWEWGTPSGRPILLIHATGFHARVWDQTIARLPESFRIISVDMRGHGQSEKKGLLLDWSLVAKDVGELVAHLDLKNVIGVGHSMGGHCLSQVARAHPGMFERLVLIDPVMMEPERYTSNPYHDLTDPSEHPVARRRDAWTGWEEMYERFRDRHPYSLWKPEALEDYCRYGVRHNENGDGYRLACPPVMEASVYMGSVNASLYGQLDAVTAPVTILRAKGREPDADAVMDFAISPTWDQLYKQFPNARNVSLPHLSHFIPMQDPALTAHFILNADATADEAVAVTKGMPAAG